MRVNPFELTCDKTMNENRHLDHAQLPNNFLLSYSKDTANEEMFSTADEILNKLAVDFVEGLPGELLKIDEAMADLEAALGDKARFNTFFCLIHDLKGMAGSFDYVMMTVIGNDLCRFIEHTRPLTLRHMKVIRFHVEALNMVAKKGITGDGGETATRTLNTLHSMTQKALQED